MKILRSRARKFGLVAIAAIVALQAFNSLACYGHDLNQFIVATAFFVGVPLIPAFVGIVMPNPLRAVAACALFAPWLLFAFYTDCVRPYAGGGASMIYVAVLLWGTISALVGAIIGGFMFRSFGLEVIDG